MSELLPGPVGAAFHRADRAAANSGGLLVGKSRRSDEKQRLALVLRELGEGDLELFEVKVGKLRSLLGKRCSEAAFRIGDLARQLTELGVKSIAQDREEPSPQIGARRVARAVRPRLDQRFLDEIVGPIRISGYRPRKCSQTRYLAQQPITKAYFRCHWRIHPYRQALSTIRRTYPGADARRLHQTKPLALRRSPLVWCR